ncbi:MAG TPA: DUF3488 and transglutaminase-like domain-containing protein [Bryobacteraceae bacterium]|nr:DUF3488 and transglutaminase-like domain-containing protein [Bryobacteraceae bacterium]
MQALSGCSAPVERVFQLSILGLLASGFLALAGSGYVDPITVLVIGGALSIRALFVAGLIRFDTPPRAVTAVTLAYVGFYPIDWAFISHNFLQATARLILFLAAVMALTANSDRQYLFLRLIAFLELIAASVLSPNLNFIVFLALFLFFAVGALASGELRRASKNAASPSPVPGGLPPALWANAVMASSGILVVTAGLFFLLPRTARAALEHFVPARLHVAGFSSEVNLGGTGSIAGQSAPVMHIVMEDGKAPPQGLKWRGATLSYFDGRRWSNPPGMSALLYRDRHGLFVLASDDQRRSREPRLNYKVWMTDEESSAVFFAGAPEFLWLEAPTIIRNAPGTYTAHSGTAGPLAYQAETLLEADVSGDADPLPEDLRRRYVQLPLLDPRIAALAGSVTTGEVSDFGKARALESYLQHSYRYTSELPATESRDPLARFLFERRAGHCEYFASALAVMLRTLNIPARLATGYQSGVWNPVNSTQLIRAGDAHAWVEAWFPDRGWFTLDATPPADRGVAAAWWTTLSLWTDAAQVFWHDWVLGYSLNHQLTLAARVEDSTRRIRAFSWPDLFSGQLLRRMRSGAVESARRYGLPATAGIVAVTLLAFLGPRLWRIRARRRHEERVRRGDAAPGDAALLYGRVLNALRRKGFEKPGWMTPLEFARVLPDPELAAMLEDATHAYNQLRFGAQADSAGRMLRLVNRIECF